MAEGAQLVQPKLTLGALREQLATAEDLQHHHHIQELLFK
jgi:hypothetical protein